jgi:hypothetical protein
MQPTYSGVVHDCSFDRSRGVMIGLVNISAAEKSRKNKTGRCKSLPVAVLHDEGRANILGRPRRREAAGGHCGNRRAVRSRLRAVIALDDDQIECGMRQAHLEVFLIFWRAITRERGGIVGKLDDDVARAAMPFHSVEFQASQRAPRAAARTSSPAVLREWRSGISRQKFRPRRSRRPARRGRAPCRDW